jgi:uncharacterized LabA/DUF88 family protein
MANFLYVDNSNVWIEGMHLSAFVNGIAPTMWDALQLNICDYSWKIDFGRLIEFAGGKPEEIGRAVLYGSRPPANDSLWAHAKKHGFEVVVHDRSMFAGREKKVDTNIVTDITADGFELMKPGKDEITLVAGDADYVPTVQRLRKRGLQFDVCFWHQASNELKNAATKFIELDDRLEYLRLK